MQAANFRMSIPMHMTTSTREVAGVTIVDISGRMVLGDESAALRDLDRLLLSMGRLIQSCQCQSHEQRGFGPPGRCFHERVEQAGELKLLNLTNKVHDLMQITRLVTVFAIIDDQAAAVKSFAKSAGAVG